MFWMLNPSHNLFLFSKLILVGKSSQRQRVRCTCTNLTIKVLFSLELHSLTSVPFDDQLDSLFKWHILMPCTILSTIDVDRALVNVFVKLSMQCIYLISIFLFC